MLVNRQVRQEAAKILFSKNHFVLGYKGFDWTSSMYEDYFLHESSLRTLARSHIRSISTTIDVRPAGGDALDSAYAYRRWAEMNYDWELMTAEQRMAATHDESNDTLGCWKSICEQAPEWRFLQIDISNCYCPLGCHRNITEAAKAIAASVSNGT